jgi:RecB family endonuclease NucS
MPSSSRHLNGCVVNRRANYFGSNNDFAKFLFLTDDNSYEVYTDKKHPPNEWQPEGDEVKELIDASISLECDIEDHLIANLDALEKGLTFIDSQVVIEIGRIDILAKDKTGERVIIEIKTGEAKDKAIGQIARYMGWYGDKEGKPVRGPCKKSCVSQRG